MLISRVLIPDILEHWESITLLLSIMSLKTQILILQILLHKDFSTSRRNNTHAAALTHYNKTSDFLSIPPVVKRDRVMSDAKVVLRGQL
jgi:hypothetical protein